MKYRSQISSLNDFRDSKTCPTHIFDKSTGVNKIDWLDFLGPEILQF